MHWSGLVSGQWDICKIRKSGFWDLEGRVLRGDHTVTTAGNLPGNFHPQRSGSKSSRKYTTKAERVKRQLPTLPSKEFPQYQSQTLFAKHPHPESLTFWSHYTQTWLKSNAIHSYTADIRNKGTGLYLSQTSVKIATLMDMASQLTFILLPAPEAVCTYHVESQWCSQLVQGRSDHAGVTRHSNNHNHNSYSVYQTMLLSPIKATGLHIRGRPYMTSAKFSGFWTPSPPCPHLGLIYCTKFTQPPLLHLLLG